MKAGIRGMKASLRVGSHLGGIGLGGAPVSGLSGRYPWRSYGSTSRDDPMFNWVGLAIAIGMAVLAVAVLRLLGLA